MFELRSKRKWYCPPGKWFYGPTPLPSGISWASDPPTPLEFPIPSVVGVWIFSGTTHSGILETFACGIQNLGNFSCGIQNPGLRKLEFSSRNPESTTVFDYLTRGDLIQKPTSQFQAEANMHITWPPLIPHIHRKNISSRKENYTSVTVLQ